MSQGVAPPATFPAQPTHAGPSFVRPTVHPTPGPPPPTVSTPAFIRPAPTFQPSGFTQVHPPAFQPAAIHLTHDEPRAPAFAPAPAPTDPSFQAALDARRLAAETIAKRLAAQFGQQAPGIGTYEGVASGGQKEEEVAVVDTSGMDGVDVVDLLARQVERDASGGGAVE